MPGQEEGLVANVGAVRTSLNSESSSMAVIFARQNEVILLLTDYLWPLLGEVLSESSPLSAGYSSAEGEPLRDGRDQLSL
jgi:hypothetical protein